MIDAKQEEFGAAMTAAENEVTYFKADSALLRELGERLVGKPYIALAELIKNSYEHKASSAHKTG